MKQLISLLVLVVLFQYVSFAQQSGLPKWYMEKIQTDEGIWVTDNSQFKNENEPFDKYILSWTLNPLRNSLSGRLYGLTDGQESGTFWDFSQYYDPNTQKVIVMQIGWNGTLGSGPLIATDNGGYDLAQIFTTPDGTTRKEKHTDIKPNKDIEITTSYSFDENSEWIAGRTYTWQRQIDGE